MRVAPYAAPTPSPSGDDKEMAYKERGGEEIVKRMRTLVGDWTAAGMSARLRDALRKKLRAPWRWSFALGSTFFLAGVVPLALLGPLLAQLLVTLALPDECAPRALAHAATVFVLNVAATLLPLPTKCGDTRSALAWWAAPGLLALAHVGGITAHRLTAVATVAPHEATDAGVDDAPAKDDAPASDARDGAKRRLPGIAVVWLAHCFYALASIHSLDAPAISFTVAPLLYAATLCALLRYDAPAPALPPNACGNGGGGGGGAWRRLGAHAATVGGGACLSWLAVAAAAIPVAKVIAGAEDVTSAWCDAYAVAHAAVHAAFLAVCAALALALALTAGTAALTSRLGRALAPPLLLLWRRGGGAHAAAAPPRPNVLFIMADDMRAEVASAPYARRAWGARTPHLDRLLARATVFSNAHAQGVTCTPSRASMMTGLRPTATGFWQHGKRMAERGCTTLPMVFRAAGMHARAPNPRRIPAPQKR
jgi:hypothetical protein